ncbi:hypothetical protein [Nocardia tengchongensis]|uniref:hypothetical protein n=1 Tax=Nocardia tengchongensis TaxID=2055889 RepID=UPI0036585172
MTWETWLLVSLLAIGAVVIVGALVEDWRGTRRLDPPSDGHGVLTLRTVDGGYLEVPLRAGCVTSHRRGR